jgi:hypothetical protein
MRTRDPSSDVSPVCSLDWAPSSTTSTPARFPRLMQTPEGTPSPEYLFDDKSRLHHQRDHLSLPWNQPSAPGRPSRGEHYRTTEYCGLDSDFVDR